LSLARNQLRRVDISPLLFSKRLESLTFDDGVILESLFLPELTALNWGFEENRHAIIEVDLGNLFHRISWSTFTDLASKFMHNASPLQQREFQNSLLHRLGLFHFDIVDFNLDAVIRTLPPDSSLESFTEVVKQVAFKALSEHVNDGGYSHFINIDEVRKNPDLAVLAPAILEARKQEQKGIVVEEMDGIFDLRPLWMTSYGFDLLSALRMGLDTDQQGMDQVILHADQTGFDLRTRIRENRSTKESYTDPISQYILKRAELT
jgi:hypothetical protein